MLLKKYKSLSSAVDIILIYLNAKKNAYYYYLYLEWSWPTFDYGQHLPLVQGVLLVYPEVLLLLQPFGSSLGGPLVHQRLPWLPQPLEAEPEGPEDLQALLLHASEACLHSRTSLFPDSLCNRSGLIADTTEQAPLGMLCLLVISRPDRLHCSS